MQASVSVIIPTWNRSSTVAAAVMSALAQSLSPLEVLVCDDGSDDDTEAVVASLADRRVRWLPGERGGRPAIPRNRGIVAAKGEWIAFLDSDDEWISDKLELQIQLIHNQGSLVACSNAWRFVPGEGRKGLLSTKKIPSNFGLRELLRGNLVVCSSVIVHRSILARTMMESGIFFPENSDLTVGEDYAFWLRIACFTNFCADNSPLVVYRDDPLNSIRHQALPLWSIYHLAAKDLMQWCSSARGCKEAETALPLVRRRFLKTMPLHWIARLSRMLPT